MTKRQLRRVFDHMHDHLAEEIDVSTLVALTGLRRARFFAIFKRSVGNTPFAHLRCLRLLQAKRLLLETEMSITAISASVGLEPTRLSAAFKQAYGMTPSKFRISYQTAKATEPQVQSGDSASAGEHASIAVSNHPS